MVSFGVVSCNNSGSLEGRHRGALDGSFRDKGIDLP
jgi:hypothetical protein